MPFEIDFFASFRSPYSYLAAHRAFELAQEDGVDMNLRIVMPLAIRDRDFFKDVNPLWPPYVFRDVARVAEFEGIDIRWPQPDPIVQEFPSRIVADDQPYIFRLVRLGQAAVEAGQGVAFFYEAMTIIWNGKTQNWHEGEHLARAAERAGLDLDALEKAALENAKRFDEAIETNQKDLEAAGHWGVPTFVFNGEPFFGQDRIALLRWRLEQNGLPAR